MNLRRWYLTAVGVIVLGCSTNVFGQAPEPPQPADASPAPVAEISDSPSSETPTISVPEAMKAASEALSKKQFDRARELYLSVYRADPTHHDAALQ